MSVWRGHQKALGVYSACSIPLFKKDKIEYILILYSNIADILSDKYLSLIKQIQVDISFALEKIEKDKELKILDNAFSASTDWVFVTDNKGVILKVNKAAETISCYTAAELVGKNLSIFKSNYHSSDFYKKMYDSITKGKQCKCVFTNRKKEGSLFYLDSVIVPITVNEKIERYVNIARDITKRIELNRQIEKISNIYKMLYSINQLIIKTDNEDGIFKKLPKLMIDILGATLSFVATVKNNEIVNIFSHNTKNGNYKQLLDFLEHKIKTAPCSQELPLIKSIKKGHIYIENNITFK